MGGTLLDQPTGGSVGVADYVYIENGYLMDLGYWGFFLGAIKILGEMIISYQALGRFLFKDKVIIMIALWGVAIMNNNTFFAFLLPFYLCSYLAFGANISIKHRKVCRWLDIIVLYLKFKYENKNRICISQY